MLTYYLSHQQSLLGSFSFFPPNANLLRLSTIPLIPDLPEATWLGVLEYEGGTSRQGLDVKKFLGRSRTDIGSAGITG